MFNRFLVSPIFSDIIIASNISSIRRLDVMNYRNQKLIVFILLISLTFLLGCSRGSSTIIPDDATYDSLPAVTDAGQTGMDSDRQMQGMWETSFDLEGVGNLIGQSVPIEPIRTADLHLNVRPFIKTPKIFVRSWNPTTETLDLDVLIENTSIYNGYDLRLIIFRDTIGHKLLNPDNYTHLWDIPEGTYSNGFIAYAKDNTNRILQAGEWKTERLQILCPGGNFSIKFAIDASWPSNCEEPYMMNNFTQGMLQAYQGATSNIAVDVYDWQDNVDSVRIQCSAITGQTDTYMTKISGTKWGVELINNNAVPEGDYFALIAATSAGSIDPLIHIVNVTVSPEVGNGWAQTWGGVGADEGYGVAVDDAGSIYTTGVFESTVDFNPDPVEEEVRTSNGLGDAFLVKFNQYGDFQWVKTWGGVSGDVGYDVEIDKMGNILVAGIFRGTVNFDTVTGPDIHVSTGGSDCALTKYTPDGDYIGTITWGGSGSDEASAIAVDSDNNVIVTGIFWSTNMDFDPDPVDQFIRSTNGEWDAYLCKFDSSGDFKWAGTWGASNTDYGKGVCVDSLGNVYCSGNFRYTVDFDPGPGTATRSASGSSWYDAFLSSFDADGNFRWVGTWGSTEKDDALECAVDEYDDVYVCGSFYYTVDFNPDPIETEERTAVWYDDAYVSMFSPDGDFQWVLVWGDTTSDDCKAIATDGNGHFYAMGDALARNNVRKFNLDGDLEWINEWQIAVFYALAVSPDGYSYITGWFDRTFDDFDPGPEEWHPVTPSIGWDCFVIKVLPDGFWR
jgi:hypothetical protein